MFTAIVTIFQILSLVYLTGNSARQNKKLDAFLILIEDGYTGINNKIKDTRLKNGIQLLQKLYGLLAILSVISIVCVSYIYPESENYYFISSVGFILGLLGWGALSWCMQHRKMVLENAWMMVFIVASPFSLVLIESQSGVSLLWLPLEPFFSILTLLGIHIEPATGTWTLACMFSGILLFFIISQYITAWFVSIPVLLFTITVVAMAVYFSKLINILAPENAFPWLVLFINAALIVIDKYYL